MKPIRTLLIIADGAKARFFLNSGPDKGLEPLPSGEMEAGAAPTREIGSDRPGRVHDRMGPGRHAMAPRTDWHDQEKQHFVKQVAERIDSAARDKAFDRLVVVAPPKALGELRTAMAPQTAKLVTGELAKDLTQVPVQDLPEHLKEFMVL